MKKTVISALVLALAVVVAAGFVTLRGKEEVPAPAPTVTPSPEASSAPTAVPELLFPDGKTVDAGAKTLDLSALTGKQARKIPALLAEMPALKTVRLGAERENGPTWEQIRAMELAAPQAEFSYRFTLYGKEFSLDDAEIDINHTPVEDNAALLRRVMPCMPRLRYLCMDTCGVDDEHMAALREDFPEIEVVWRIWFGGGKVYSVRTNVEKILASKPTWAGEMTDAYVAPIRYCNKVKYLDLGHNEYITDLSFVRSMPDLEVLILTINPELRDISPLADCPKLEYLELCDTGVSDLSPLAGLTELRHLNLARCWLITDLTPIYGLELERLYIGALTLIPMEMIEGYRQLHPDCEVNDTLADACNGTWRYTDEAAGEFAPRYALLREQFGYATQDYSVFWLDPNY